MGLTLAGNLKSLHAGINCFIMKNQIQSLLAALTIFVTGNHLVAQGTAFSYQGQLKDGSAPANGLYDLRFAIFDAATNGNQVAASLTNSDTAVSNGLFTVALDFGTGVFDGNVRWLEIGVRTNSGTTFATLTSRQSVTAVPYAIYAESGGTATMLAGGTALGAGSGNSIASGVSDAFIGGGSQNIASTNYVVIGGGYYNAANGDSATVSGGSGNTASGNSATVAGGNGNTASGAGSFIGGGGINGGYVDQGNINQGESAAIVGGVRNLIQSNADYAFIGAGYENAASGESATVGGGSGNTASGNSATVVGGNGNTASGTGSFVGGGGNDGYTAYGNASEGNAAAIVGGLGNVIQSSAWYSFIGGGLENKIQDFAAEAFIGGGYQNTNAGEWAVVGGGSGNAAINEYTALLGGLENVASGSLATVGGGSYNTASGNGATVPGGYGNSASGRNSFAAGSNAHATNDGAFVWSDGSAQTSDSNTNQFVARASGGFVFYTSATNTGVILPPGSGSWSTMSDRNAKEDFAAINPRAVLARVASLPLTTWSYKTEQGVRHIGPMAQDFYVTFKVGEDNKHIADVDEGGVALAAIQGLNNKMEEQLKARDAEIEQLQKTVAQLKAAMHKLASKQPIEQ